MTRQQLFFHGFIVFLCRDTENLPTIADIDVFLGPANIFQHQYRFPIFDEDGRGKGQRVFGKTCRRNQFYHKTTSGEKA